MNTIYCFWTGHNEMSEDRRNCYEQMKRITGCTIDLVTVDSLSNYILPDHPLHEGYAYLSETHKADYLRTYFMNFYGGGYSDIKMQTGDWNMAFDSLKQSDAYINGYHEDGEWSISCLDVKHDWADLPGNCAYICKPNTPLTNIWYSRMIAFLDTKLDELRQYPSRFPQDQKELGQGYPIGWVELLGDIFHRVCSEYKDRILFDVPKVDFYKYR